MRMRGASYMYMYMSIDLGISIISYIIWILICLVNYNFIILHRIEQVSVLPCQCYSPLSKVL